jgi:hypothetical protein
MPAGCPKHVLLGLVLLSAACGAEDTLNADQLAIVGQQQKLRDLLQQPGVKAVGYFKLDTGADADGDEAVAEAAPSRVQLYPFFHCIVGLVYATTVADAMRLSLCVLGRPLIRCLAAAVAIASSGRLVYIVQGFGEFSCGSGSTMCRSIVSTLPFSGQWLLQALLGAIFQSWMDSDTFKPPEPQTRWIAPLMAEHLTVSTIVLVLFLSMEALPAWVNTIGGTGTCFISSLFFAQSFVHLQSLSILSTKFELDYRLSGGVVDRSFVTALPMSLLAQALVNFCSFFARECFFHFFVPFQSVYYTAEILPSLVLLGTIARAEQRTSTAAKRMVRTAGAA